MITVRRCFTGVVERIAENVTSQNEDCTRQFKKQDERTLKLVEDINCLDTQLKESIRQGKKHAKEAD